ncbi:MAG: hypothetical protein K6E38_02335 [Fretibacterium sp.]|nr:hypothetical protein [Fretibacterium sp.]
MTEFMLKDMVRRNGCEAQFVMAPLAVITDDMLGTVPEY